MQERWQEQNEILLELAARLRKPETRVGEAYRCVTEAGARYLGVERSSVWLFEESGERLHEVDLFRRDDGLHDQGTVLEKSENPPYFDALESARSLAISKVREDPRTKLFGAEYFDSGDINSLLDAPIIVMGQVVGVACFESSVENREWTEEELAFAASMADILALTVARRQRRRLDRHLRVLMKSTQQAVFFLSQQLTVRHQNRAARELAGVGAEALTGQPIRQLLEELTSEEADALLLNAHRVTQMTLLNAEGERVPVDVSLAVADEDDQASPGDPGTLILMVDDLRPRLEHERALQLREVLLENVVEDQTDFILRAKPGGVIVFANRAALEFWGLDESIYGKSTVFDFVPDEDHAIIHDSIAKLSPENPVTAHEHRAIRTDGSIILVSWVTRGFYDHTGRRTGVQAIGRDVTAERAHAEQMEQAQRLESLAVLSGGVAHDFNNLLTPILGYTELLRSETDPNSETFEQLTEIHRAARRAEDLVRQILLFSRPDNDERGPLDAAPFLKDTMRFVASSLPATIEVNVDIDPSCGVVVARPIDFYQILSNLCTNAMQAMSAGGRLTVQASRIEEQERQGSALLILVRDSGHGISTEDQERVFEPFFTTKGPQQGTGLGLSVVHGLVRSLGGDIDLQSDPKTGTTFSITLPLAAPTEAPLESGHHKLHGGNENILVVDDEAAVAQVARQMLENLGYSVSVAHSANEALSRIGAKSGEFDLVLTDLTMPHLSGVELARRLQGRFPELRVVLMTGFEETARDADLSSAGLSSFVLKPFGPHELGGAIRSALDEKR